MLQPNNDNHHEEAVGGDQNPPQRRRRNRHSQSQIQAMEAFFAENPHPNINQREELSLQLGLHPLQIQSWFQNKRTKLKNHQERLENEQAQLRTNKRLIEESVRQLAKDKKMMIELAVGAMNELLVMAEAGHVLWLEGVDGMSLDFSEYETAFGNGIAAPLAGFTTEASISTATVAMDPATIVNMFMQTNQWSEMFVGMVNRATNHEQIASNVTGDGDLQVMSAEYMVPSPLVSTRESFFLRYCKKEEDGSWAVVDIFIDHLLPNMHPNCRRKPSGCLIQEVPGGYSKALKMFNDAITPNPEWAELDFDLVIEILSKMPVKSLLKFKCLSKEISRIIHSRNFVDSCLSCSSNRPRLLFYFSSAVVKKLVFFSAPHHHRSSCAIAPTRHDLTFGGVPGGTCLSSPPVRGLILCTFGPNQHFICNLATRHNISLPQNQMLRSRLGGFSTAVLIFGYSPLVDEFKVLWITSNPNNVFPREHQFWVLTVGQVGWRQIQGMPPHLSPSIWGSTSGGSGICINGVLYFKAFEKTPSPLNDHTTTHLVSFDLISEQFSVFKTNYHLRWWSKLIDFQGRLAFLSRVQDSTIELFLMEHNKWSSKVFHSPWFQSCDPNHPYQIATTLVLGICDGELVFLPPDGKFGFTWHLSLDKNTIRKVHFQVPSEPYDWGIYGGTVHFFLNHVDTTVLL